jgi:ankyrin repeat protein
VCELLDRGANIEAANNGATSLFIASKLGHLVVVRELLSRGANIEAVTGDTNTTLLMVASCFGHIDVVRALLEAGADKRIADSFGYTAASFAGNDIDALPGSRAIILALLAAAP